MTHYDIDYTGLEGKAKVDKAIADVIDYTGQDRFDKLCQYLREFVERHEGKVPTLGQIRIPLSFGGIQGYPVKAIHEFLWPDAVKERETDSVED